jgi:hypothetical protein
MRETLDGQLIEIIPAPVHQLADGVLAFEPRDPERYFLCFYLILKHFLTMNTGYIYNSTRYGYARPNTRTSPSSIRAAYTHTNPTAHIHPKPQAGSPICKDAQRSTAN